MKPQSWADYNRRRSELSIKKHMIDGGLSREEEVELEKLQRLAKALADLVAPMPPRTRTKED